MGWRFYRAACGFSGWSVSAAAHCPSGVQAKQQTDGGPENIAATLDAMACELWQDTSRPCIGAHRRHDEVTLFLPVVVDMQTRDALPGSKIT